MSLLTSTDQTSRFRDAMANVCTPVTVVTAMDHEGPHGTTVSAFSSLSLDPMMILVSLDLRSSVLDMIGATGRFGVNVLARSQHGLATTFSQKDVDRFARADWTLDAGLPRLSGSAAWIGCDLEAVVPAGDHKILLGAVSDVDCAGNESPLTYFRRTFGTHLAISA